MELESNHENTKSQNHENKEKDQFEELSRKIIGGQLKYIEYLGQDF